MSREISHVYGVFLDCIKNGRCIFFAIKFIVAIQNLDLDGWLLGERKEFID